MVIKSLSRKSKSFGQLLKYIDAPVLTNKSMNDNEPVVHNLSVYKDQLTLEQAFMANAEPIPKRKNGVYLYHEILSFHEDDAKHIDAAILRDLAQHWLSLRAPGCIGYARAHFNTDNPHIHCMISANEIHSSQKFRLSRSQFRSAKIKLEQYQQQKYPQLSASLAQPAKRPKKRLQKTTREGERDRRQDPVNVKLSQKEQLRVTIESCLRQALSEGDYRLRLLAIGLKIYQRGKHLGVIKDGKKYRLATLGLEYQEQQKRTRWERVRLAIKDLRRMAVEKLQRHLKTEYRFAERIHRVLSFPSFPSLKTLAQKIPRTGRRRGRDR